MPLHCTLQCIILSLEGGGKNKGGGGSPARPSCVLAGETRGEGGGLKKGGELTPFPPFS